MQFQTQEKVGDSTKTVSFEFFNRLNYPAKSKFREIFWYLGATQIRGTRDGWIFPIQISNETISIIIKNTCFVCGGLMKDGQAIQNGVVKVYGEDVRGGYTPYIDPTNHKVIKVRKCSMCGHSHT